MRIIEHNKECCGCGACESICPKKAISFFEDQESFFYPVINTELCINCGLCSNACPLNYSSFQNTNNVIAFVGVHKSNEIAFNSSSGGAFSAICSIYISKGYKVYGACFGENFKVIHDAASTIEECKKFRKSKYVQSYYNDCYNKIDIDLKNGNKVLFSGVSCQCAALLGYLAAKQTSCSNLITININCQGVPSQKMFDTYIKEQKKEIISYKFKNKCSNKGEVNTRTSYITYANGKSKIKTIDNDAFLLGYYTRLFYRPSCYFCRFARKERIADITIADAWGIETIKGEYNSLAGVSLILLNNSKAHLIMEQINQIMKLERISSDWALTSQSTFLHPTHQNPNREKFFLFWEKYGFSKGVFKCSITWKHYIGKLIPKKARNSLKKLINR